MSKEVYLILILTFFSVNLKAQEDLYSKVFGNLESDSDIEFFLNKRSVGEVSVKIKGESLYKVSGEQLREKLRLLVKEKIFESFKIEDNYLKITESPYEIIYDPRTISCEIKIPIKHLKASLNFMDNNPKIKYAGRSLEKEDMYDRPLINIWGWLP